MSTLRTTQVDVPEGVIDLGVGQPDRSVYPVEIFKRAASVCFGDGGPVEHFQYGPEYGDGAHRVALAEFLGAAYGFPVDPELLFSTNGNSQALDMVCTVFTRPGDVVLVEEPSYFLAGGIFTDHGLETVGIPVDDLGLNPEDVDSVIVRLKKEGRQVRFIYTIPAFHNPAGVTMSTERRVALVEVAARHGVSVVADEVYHLLPSVSQVSMPPAMSRWVESSVVLSLGTFSKILAPGLRLGWIHSATDNVKALADSGLVVSGGGLNPMASRLATEVITNGDLASNISKLRSDYSDRIQVMQTALDAYMPDGVRWATPGGGYFFWLELPKGVDGSLVRRAARSAGVDYRDGALFSSQGGLRNYLRLSFAYYRADEITEGVARLGRVLDAT